MRVVLVVPTLGRSPLLGDCLRSLRVEAAALGEAAREGGGGAEVLLVVQGAGGALEGFPRAAELADRRIELPRPVGFAGAVDRGIAASEAPYVAVVNDDAVVEPGWLAALLSALEAHPGAAAAQGVNLLAADPGRIDGSGLGWNRWLQAVQLGHGEPAPPEPPPSAAGPPPREVFGVSATAALYRRDALLAVALPPRRRAAEAAGAPAPAAAPEVFDSGLGAYYEDVDLAVRLRSAGYRALSAPAARARHAGSLTAGSGAWRWRLVYGNRHLVAARLLGRSYCRHLPRMAARDLADLLGALGRGELRRAAGIVLGWGRAAWRLPGYLRGGPALLAPAELAGARAAGASAEEGAA